MKKGNAEVLRPRFYLQKTRPHNRAMAPRTKRGFRPNLGHVFENGALASTWAAFFMAAASKTRPKAPVSCSACHYLILHEIYVRLIGPFKIALI